MDLALENIRQSTVQLVADRLVPRGLERPDSLGKWNELLEVLAKRGLVAPGDRLPDLPSAGAVLEGLSIGGMDVGVPMTLTVNYIIGFKVLLRLAPDLLQEMQFGRGLACMGASEPKVGSHPGKITTRAQRDGPDWIVDGLKVFTTGGPLGVVFLVLAVCGETSEGRDLGVFAIPRNTPGFTVSEMPVHSGLECAPHGVLKLESVRLPSLARLGPAGVRSNGWTEIVKPFRQWEDALMASWIAGLLWRNVLELKTFLKPVDGRLAGRFVAASRTLLTLARDSAYSFLDEEAGAPAGDLVARRYGFFEQLRQIQALADESAARLGQVPSTLLQVRALLNQLRFAETARGKIVAGLAG